MANRGKTTIVPTSGPNKVLTGCVRIEILFEQNIMQVFYTDTSGPKTHPMELTQINSISWTQ